MGMNEARKKDTTLEGKKGGITKIIVDGHQIEVPENMEVIIKNGEVQIRNIQNDIKGGSTDIEKKIDEALYHQRIESELDKIFIAPILRLFGMKV